MNSFRSTRKLKATSLPRLLVLCITMIRRSKFLYKDFSNIASTWNLPYPTRSLNLKVRWPTHINENPARIQLAVGRLTKDWLVGLCCPCTKPKDRTNLSDWYNDIKAANGWQDNSLAFFLNLSNVSYGNFTIKPLNDASLVQISSYSCLLQKVPSYRKVGLVELDMVS